MQRFFLVIAVSLAISHICTPALGATSRGFLEGPYILLNGGVTQFSQDRNATTGVKETSTATPIIGANFGWNLTDAFATELQVRYFNRHVRGGREHVALAGMNAVYNMVIPGLTKGDVKLVPFLHGGVLAEIATIPGDGSVSNVMLTTAGPGLTLAAGLRILFLKYGFAGIVVQNDIVYLVSQSQMISGIPVKIVSGGWDMQIGGMGQIGVHF